MTIRAKLLAAIVLTIIGPVVTIGVALAAFGTLGERFDDVGRVGARQARALELKFAVTDMNGWQTAYGYDDGRSRPAFERAAESTKGLLEAAGGELTAPRERALQAGRRGETKRILLGPELRHFATMARAADALADEQDRRAAAAEREFRDARRTARRELVAVGIGAGVVIVLLLLTVQDVVRLALERRLT